MHETDQRLDTFSANKSGNRLEAIEAVNIAARHGIKTRYELKKMTDLTSVSPDCTLCETLCHKSETADLLGQIFEDMEAGKINGRIVLDLR